MQVLKSPGQVWLDRRFTSGKEGANATDSSVPQEVRISTHKHTHRMEENRTAFEITVLLH